MESFILLLIIGVCIYYFSKNSKKQQKKIQPSIQPYKEPSIGPFRRDVEKRIDDNQFNKIFSFELTSTHLPKSRKFFKNEAFEYLLVDVIPEPKNKFDTGAISVQYDGVIIGYVPKTHQKGVKKVTEQINSFSYIKSINYRYDANKDYEYLDVKIDIPYKFE